MGVLGALVVCAICLLSAAGVYYFWPQPAAGPPAAGGSPGDDPGEGPGGGSAGGGGSGGPAALPPPVLRQVRGVAHGQILRLEVAPGEAVQVVGTATRWVTPAAPFQVELQKALDARSSLNWYIADFGALGMGAARTTEGTLDFDYLAAPPDPTPREVRGVVDGQTVPLNLAIGQKAGVVWSSMRTWYDEQGSPVAALQYSLDKLAGAKNYVADLETLRPGGQQGLLDFDYVVAPA